MTEKAGYLSWLAIRSHYLTRSFFAGLLLPIGFAPFHLPGFMFLSLALLFSQLDQLPLHLTRKASFLSGFVFGLGFLGLGVSWVYVSMRMYGHLPHLVAACITLLFVVYLALFLGGMTFCYIVCRPPQRLIRCFLFSACWVLFEYARATFLTGFPWLSLGFGQVDTPLKHLLPLIGLSGVSFFTCFAATLLATAIQTEKKQRVSWLISFVLIILLPLGLQQHHWTSSPQKSLSVGIIQANLSMRDKWDESLFFKLLNHYEAALSKLLPRNQLVVMPESSIPLPSLYVAAQLQQIAQMATHYHSAVLFGIPKASTQTENAYYNTLMSLGLAQGQYRKQHLVPFGEFVPKPFHHLLNWLTIPMNNMLPGKASQKHVFVQGHPIATLICYELAYPALLQHQLPAAEWIVSISDDGWFGHSFALYQHLQMAQALSIQTERDQIVANNDGLSSVIHANGQIVDSLPAFKAGLLEAKVQPRQGSTPWINWGDTPILIICCSIMGLALAARHKRRYPNRPN